MSWRKNALSYLLWAAYTVMTGLAMAGMGNIFCDEMGLPSFCGALFAVVLTVASGGAAFALRRFSPVLTAQIRKRRVLRLWAEAVPLFLLCVLGIVLRAAGLKGVEEISVYYEMAEVTMGQDMPLAAHGAVHVYVLVLHLVFLFLGNHFVLGIIVQMIFQGIAALLLYIQIRKYIGAAAALVFMGFFTCAPGMVRAGLALSPDMLYLCLMAASGIIVARCIQEGGKEGRRPASFFFSAGYSSLAGVVISAVAYLDVAGTLLLPFALCMIFLRGRAPEGTGKKALSALCCVLGFALGFIGCAWAASLARGESLGGVLQDWLLLYRPEAFRMPVAAGPGDSRAESLVLLVLMALGIFSFWFRREKERLPVQMLASCAVILAGCFGILTEEMPGTLFLYLLFIIMAGTGLQQCFEPGRVPGTVQEAPAGDTALKDLTKREQTAGQEPGEKPAALAKPEETAVRSPDEEKHLDEEKYITEIFAGKKGQGRDKVQEQPENSRGDLAGKEPEGKKEIQYLENPLPLPRKHEKKVLDYDYPVADDDDFDI